MKKRIRNSSRKILVGVFGAMILISLIILFSSSNSNKIVKNKKYSYESKVTPTYKVNLKQNEYINQNSLDMDKGYLRDLTENVEINYEYLYEGTKATELSTSYFVNATLVIQTTVDGNKVVLVEKEYDLKDEKIQKKTEKQNKIKETVIIDLEQYEAFAESFKDTYGISVDAYLDVTFNVNTNGNFDDEEINAKNSATVKIDLLDKIYKIETNTKDESNSSIYEEYIEKNKTGYIIALIIFAIGVFGIGYIIFNTKDLKLQTNTYKSEKYSILRNYGDRIVELKDNLQLDKKKAIIELINFEEIAKVADELWQPILYFDDKQAKKAYYYVVTDTLIYVVFVGE